MCQGMTYTRHSFRVGRDRPCTCLGICDLPRSVSAGMVLCAKAGTRSTPAGDVSYRSEACCASGSKQLLACPICFVPAVGCVLLPCRGACLAGFLCGQSCGLLCMLK